MIALDSTHPNSAKIRVIGVGGGGGNAINSMITLGLEGVDFVAANTDKQALDHNLAQTTIQVGSEITDGLGAGADPEIGKRSVMENAEEIKEILKGSDMIFVTGGMGGGTGTGGAPIIAQFGRELGALVVGIVTKPFIWEGRKRMIVAEQGIKELRNNVDALIVIPNQKLLDVIDKNTTFGEAFRKVDEVLYNATRGIADIISRHGMVNVDFADVRTVMKGMGEALMGIGTASGEHRAVEATEDALNSPLLDGISISGAQGVLVNITGGSDMTMHEVTESVSIVEKAAGEDANLIHGVVYNEEESEEIMVTVVATGFKNYETSREYETEVKTKEMVKSPKLPFSTFADKQATKYAPTKIGFGGAGQLAIEKAVEKCSSINTIPDELTPSPKGVKQLKRYDRPAYERRCIDPMAKIENEAAGVEKGAEPAGARFESIHSKKVEQPAFLRKIMD